MSLEARLGAFCAGVSWEILGLGLANGGAASGTLGNFQNSPAHYAPKLAPSDTLNYGGTMAAGAHGMLEGGHSSKTRGHSSK